jgi:hypothetical protein
MSDPHVSHLLSSLAEFGPLLLEMGAEAKFDYANGPKVFNARLGNCYELAASAFIGAEPHSPFYRPEAAAYPTPATLVHGSWHGPGAPSRIDHAWVLLDDDRVWEPITATIYLRAPFYEIARCEHKQTYTSDETLSNMVRHEHYGPWVPPYI